MLSTLLGLWPQMMLGLWPLMLGMVLLDLWPEKMQVELLVEASRHGDCARDGGNPEGFLLLH